MWHLIGKEHLIEITLFCDLNQFKKEAFADPRLVGLSFLLPAPEELKTPFCNFMVLLLGMSIMRLGTMACWDWLFQ